MTLSGAVAAARLVQDGHLVRVWTRHVPSAATTVLGLYRADGETELDRLLGALPLSERMNVTVTPLGPHPDDPANPPATPAAMTDRLPAPRLTPWRRPAANRSIWVRRPTAGGGSCRRRAGRSPKLSGTLVPDASADWQTVLPDGTALGDIRYTLRMDSGDLLYVQSRGVRHGPVAVLARLGRGEDVNAGRYTFGTSMRIETGPRPRWVNKGVSVAVAARAAAGVICDTYLVE